MSVGARGDEKEKESKEIKGIGGTRGWHKQLEAGAKQDVSIMFLWWHVKKQDSFSCLLCCKEALLIEVFAR